MNGAADALYDYYNNCNITKQVWETLKKKYDTEEAGTKTYVISHYFKYQMVDERFVEAQWRQLQKIADMINIEGMSFDNNLKLLLLLTN